VVLEDAAVQAKHLNLALDLSQSLLVGASEVGIKVSTEPVKKLKCLLVAHQVLHEHLVLSTSLVTQLLETSVVSGNPVIDEFDVVIGGVQLVLQELGVGLSIIPVGKCLCLNGHEIGNGCLTFLSLSDVSCVSLGLLVQSLLPKCIDHIKNSVKHTSCVSRSLELALQLGEHSGLARTAESAEKCKCNKSGFHFNNYKQTDSRLN
jgi:hypothetical protein